MRFFEIAAKPLVPVSSARFAKHFAKFERSNATLRAALDNFVQAKTLNPNALHSRKDTGFTNEKLRAFRHEHLMLGKVIIIYQIKNGQLRLCDCINHKGFDGSAAVAALGDYLNGLTDASFFPFAPEATPQGLTHEEKKEVSVLLYQMALDNDPALQDEDALREWIDLIPLDWDDVLKSFGGPDGLRREISTIRRNLGQTRAD